MEGAMFICPEPWACLLPPGIQRVESGEALAAQRWDLLALTRRGCRQAACVECGILLVPGECAPEALARVKAETVITCGLSPRDSLTLSSLTKPVLCVQRALPRPDGGEVVPQEFPMLPLPFPAGELLPLLGLRLLQMPLTGDPFSW